MPNLTLIEHLRVFQHTQKNLNIKDQMIYAYLDYDNSIDSTTKLKLRKSKRRL